MIHRTTLPLTGMYSTDPSNPQKRIEEFKNLVNEIHKRGMGVVLDVVYNHTANVDIFEDIEANYYHFMDADGTLGQALVVDAWEQPTTCPNESWSIQLSI